MHEPQMPTTDERGDEVHPAFGMISANRATVTPGADLFGSDIRHSRVIVVTIERATRHRRLNMDWVHPSKKLIEVEMSEAQWASFVSSIGTQGVECTLRAVGSQHDVPGIPRGSRLAISMQETHRAADKAWAGIKRAFSAYVESKTKGNLRSLQAAIDNATPNVDFAGKQLIEHAENVVQRSRADIEAMVVAHAHRAGLSADQAQELIDGGTPLGITAEKES